MTLPASDKRKPDVGLKTPFFQVLDAIGNAASAAQLRTIRKELADPNVPLMEIYEQFKKLGAKVHGIKKAELAHVSKHWVGGGWWPDAQTGPTMRAGIITVIDLQLKKKTGRPRKVDYWWIRGADDIRVVPCVEGDRVVVVVLTPTPPAP
jgi:hypothetical protein